MIKCLKDHKGLSTVVSTLLMISMVVTLFVILYASFLPTIGLTQSQANIWYGNQEDISRERIAIEMIYFYNETQPSPDPPIKNIRVFVRNVGEIDVRIVDIYVNSTHPSSVSPSLAGGYLVKVKTGTTEYVEQFVISLPNDWVSGETYYVKVVTARGNEVVSMAKAQ